MQTLDDIRPGQTIGRYEFLVPIAKGGMAAVWAARLKGSRGFAKTVAIKTMLPALSDDPLFEQMFLDEAQLAAQIHHPNVVEIMDLGEQDDVLYQVMEYVDGESLATLLRTVSKKQQRLPLEIAVRIVMDACRGLHSAHELKAVDGSLLGLVHRDISPQNIMITYDGVVKLVDFGVAKAAGRTASETTAGQIKGKAPYMAPEQALGQRVDRRTDVFAMGIVLYQITTGKHPFRGENDIATLHNILHNDLPSPRFVDAQFPRPLEAALNRALSRDISKRYDSAKEMADALSRVFPPTKRRVDVGDVGALLQEMLGETGNRRRAALAEAIKRADMRATAAPMNESSGPVLLPLTEIGTESSVNSPRMVGGATERIEFQEFTAGSRASHPGLAPITDLAGSLSAPPTLDLDEPEHRSAETVRPGRPAAPPAPDAPAFDSSSLGTPALATGQSPLGPPSDGTPGTATAAMVSLHDSFEPTPPRKRWVVFAFVGGAVFVGFAIGVTAWTLLRSPQDAESSPAAVSSPPSVATPAPVPEEAAPPPAFNVEAVSDPVKEGPDAAASATPSPTVPKGPRKPFKPFKPVPTPEPTDTKPPPTAKPPATPESTWKPPPVADPGF